MRDRYYILPSGLKVRCSKEPDEPMRKALDDVFKAAFDYLVKREDTPVRPRVKKS